MKFRALPVAGRGVQVPKPKSDVTGKTVRDLPARRPDFIVIFVRDIVDEKHLETALRRALGQGPPEKGESCPDANLTAAYLEHRLSDLEMEAFEAHAAGCESCSRTLALALTIGEESAAIPQLRLSKKLLFRFSIPVSALALIVLGAGAGILFVRTSKITQSPPPTQTAELHDSAPAGEPAAAPPSVKQAEKPMPLPQKVSSPLQAVKVKAKAPAPAVTEVATTTASTRPADDLIAELPSKPDPRMLAPARAEYAPMPAEIVSTDRAAQAKDSQSGAVGGVVGGAVGGISGAAPPVPRAATLQKTLAFNMAPGEPALHKVILELGTGRWDADSNRWKKVGDRGFRFASGYWIDEQCSKNSDAPVVETKEGAPEYEEIVKLYPDLIGLRPVAIFWKGNILILR